MRLLFLASAFFYGNIHGAEKSECCYSKTVGNYSYTLVNSSTPVPSQCKNDCVYIRDDQPDNPYCFAYGELDVQCNHKDEHCLYNLQKQNETVKKRQVEEGEGCVSVVRVKASSIGQYSYGPYNNALRTIKAYASDDERSFENIANYHGSPKMCNSGVDGLGNEAFCCINHAGISGLDELFLPWHRLYMVQMEQALIGAAQPPFYPAFGIPYWDWTEEKNMPGLATSGRGQWRNGKIKGQEDTTTSRNFRELDIEALRTLVETAYDQTTAMGFNSQINVPHGRVHGRVGGTMGTIDHASYDPIFYLHHSAVDRQYAFWQELQRIRNKPVDFVNNNWQMQPFPSNPPNPLNPFVNPFALTRDNPKAPDGLDYTSKFCYTYDNLLFKGMTPRQYLAQPGKRTTQPRLYAGITIKNKSISSRQYFDLVNGTTTLQKEIGYIATFGSSQPTKVRRNTNYFLVLYDVTKLLNNPFSDPLDQTLHFVVSKYEDSEGNPLPIEDTYKPATVYRKANSETYVIRVQVAYIELYSPVMRHCHLDSAVEFLNPDGSFSNRVTLESEETTKARNINGEFPIKKLENNFRITKTQRSNESTYINIGYNPDCHLQCDSSGIPTTGHSDIYVTPWNLNWLKCHENKVEISTCVYDTVFLAWCNGQETDIVEVSNKKDFDDCTNLDPTPVAVNDNGKIGAYIAIQNTKRSIGTHYYASKSYCQFGFKVAIEVEECL